MRKNLIKDIIYAVIVLIFLAIQSSNIIAVLGINPDLLMLLVIAHSFYFGEWKGQIFGFGMGILIDAMSGELFGLNALVYTFIAWFTMIYRKYIMVSDVVSFILYIVVATIIKYVFYIIFFLIFQRVGLLDGPFFLRFLGEIVYNGLIGVLFFFASPLLYKREEAPF